MNLEQRVQELERRLALLENGATIPYPVESAFRDRLGVGGIPVIQTSTKGVDSEDVTVNEAGASTYAVMNDPDGFLKVVISGTTYYLPYFD